VDASINYRVRDPRHYDTDAEVYDFGSDLEINCRSTWPEGLAGEDYHLTVYGSESSPGQFRMTLRDCQAKDEDGSSIFRKKAGQAVPVYDVPKGIGHFDRRRTGSSRAWSGCAWVAPRCLSDMLLILLHVRPVYVFVYERRDNRVRLIVGLTLQTTDPAAD
jgi:hypothetical protein